VPRGSPSSVVDRGADHLVLRIPRAGGRARVYAYPRVDSLVWQSDGQIPRSSRVLGFDQTDGIVLLVDGDSRPGRLDLRMSEYTRASRAALSAPAAGNGSAIFGVADGTARRFTPAGEWSYKPPRPARAVYPLRDGSVLVLVGTGERSSLLRLFPPETEVLDSLPIPGVDRTLRTQIGDVLYFVADRQLVGLRTRTYELLRPASFGDTIVAVAASPSGDRLFVLTRNATEIAIYDRFRQAVTRRIRLPSAASDIRMGPVGQYLLARASEGDSAWVVAVGSERLTGSIRTGWREDLPFIGTDGTVATLRGNDVAFTDAETLVHRSTVEGGGSDLWFPFRWSGFRPRAEGLDRPVEFEGIVREEQEPDTTGDEDGAADQRPEERRAGAGWVVSFATVLSEARAREVAATIRVGGERPRVVATDRDGTTIYRVLVGPYATREEAERVGRQAAVPYWVYEAAP
jgi:hypothetical protein